MKGIHVASSKDNDCEQTNEESLLDQVNHDFFMPVPDWLNHVKSAVQQSQLGSSTVDYLIDIVIQYLRPSYMS